MGWKGTCWDMIKHKIASLWPIWFLKEGISMKAGQKQRPSLKKRRNSHLNVFQKFCDWLISIPDLYVLRQQVKQDALPPTRIHLLNSQQGSIALYCSLHEKTAVPEPHLKGQHAWDCCCSEGEAWLKPNW